jgi:hypothetical protein
MLCYSITGLNIGNKHRSVPSSVILAHLYFHVNSTTEDPCLAFSVSNSLQNLVVFLSRVNDVLRLPLMKLQDISSDFRHRNLFREKINSGN